MPYPTTPTGRTIDAATKQYDGYKVQAVINEIDGYDHSGRHKVGVPAILGMNFQAVSVAEKVDSPGTSPRTRTARTRWGRPSSPATYPGRRRPRPLLAGALDYVNAQLQRMVDTIHARRPRVLHGDHHHGQAWSVAAGSAAAEADRRRADHQRDQRGLDRSRTRRHDNLIVAGTDDDLWQSYLSVKTQAAADFVKSYLWNHSATAVLYNNDGVNRGTEQVAHSGLAQIYAGEEAADFFGVPYSRSALPGRVRPRPGRRRLHRRHEDRRARWRQPRRPRRAAARLRARHRPPRSSDPGSRRPRSRRRSWPARPRSATR